MSYSCLHVCNRNSGNHNNVSIQTQLIYDIKRFHDAAPRSSHFTRAPGSLARMSGASFLRSFSCSLSEPNVPPPSVHNNNTETLHSCVWWPNEAEILLQLCKHACPPYEINIFAIIQLYQHHMLVYELEELSPVLTGFWPDLQFGQYCTKSWCYVVCNPRHVMGKYFSHGRTRNTKGLVFTPNDWIINLYKDNYEIKCHICTKCVPWYQAVNTLSRQRFSVQTWQSISLCLRVKTIILNRQIFIFYKQTLFC